jgi:hypothetical protein
MDRRLWMALALTGLLAGGASATQPATLAEANARGTAVDWTVLTPYQRAVLTVSMPDGEIVRSEIGPGSALTFSAFDDHGEARPDGAYNWELRLDPVLAPDVERRLAAAVARRDERAVRKIRRAHGLDREMVESGSFVLGGGVFITAEEPERTADPAVAKLGAVTAADQVVNDDLIVRGNACAGAACADGMSFPVGPLVARSGSPNLLFDDTSSNGTAHDWAFFVNGILNNSNQFSLWNLSASTVPLTIMGAAPSNSILVDAVGRVGFGTSTPAARLHIKHANPTLRLERTASPAYSWDIVLSGRSFVIHDVHSAKAPFTIFPDAPHGSIVVDEAGDVGIGTFSPETDVHVFGYASGDATIGMGPNPAGTLNESALNVGYGGASFGRGAGFLNVRPDSAAAPPNPSLRFLVANNERMILDNEGFIGLGGVPNPANPIEHSSGAVLTAGGTWQSVSSRASKRDIRALETADALAALAGLEPVRFYYKGEPGDEYVGFVAEDVPGLVATADRKRLGPLDIVAVLTKVVQQQQTAMSQQQTMIDDLVARLGELEQRQQQQK